MKNATDVDQCDTIRTLTEEEMAVVSGGFTGGSWQAINAQILAAGRQFGSRPASSYVPTVYPYHTSNFWTNQFFAVNSFSFW
jgi:hypothetical protein